MRRAGRESWGLRIVLREREQKRESSSEFLAWNKLRIAASQRKCLQEFLMIFWGVHISTQLIIIQHLEVKTQGTLTLPPLTWPS